MWNSLKINTGTVLNKKMIIMHMLQLLRNSSIYVRKEKG